MQIKHYRGGKKGVRSAFAPRLISRVEDALMIFSFREKYRTGSEKWIWSKSYIISKGNTENTLTTVVLRITAQNSSAYWTMCILVIVPECNSKRQTGEHLSIAYLYNCAHENKSFYNILIVYPN
jgi:hypothetical protein